MKLQIIIFIICALHMATARRFWFCGRKTRTSSNPSEGPVSQTPTSPPKSEEELDFNPPNSELTKVDIFDFIQLDKTKDSIGTKDIDRYLEKPCSDTCDKKLKEQLTKIRDFILSKYGSDGSVTKEQLHEKFGNDPAIIKIDLNDYRLEDPMVEWDGRYCNRFHGDDLIQKFCIPKEKVSQLLPRIDTIALLDLKYWFENGKLPVGPDRTGGNV